MEKFDKKLIKLIEEIGLGGCENNRDFYRTIIYSSDFSYGNKEGFIKVMCRISKLIDYRSTHQTNFIKWAVMRYVYKDYPINENNTCFLEEKSDEEIKMGSFRYIPFSRGEFIREILARAKNIKPSVENLHFVDVGSGLGDKVILAKHIGFKNVTGIELNRHTYEVSKFFLANYIRFKDITGHYHGKSLINLLNKNAFDVDFSTFDFIYSYMPIDSHFLSDLYMHIFKSMKIGAYYMEAHKNGDLCSALEEFDNTFLKDFQGGETLVFQKTGKNKLIFVNKKKRGLFKI